MRKDASMSNPPKHYQNKENIRIGFNSDTIELRIDQIMPLKILTVGARESRRYKQILISIKEVGVIEAPVVSQDQKNRNRYILLDGHMRIEALKELGETTSSCLVSTDDEAFTYNKHVNRISPIQEHRMILRAVERGVPEEKIAKALDVNVGQIIAKRTLLDGICSEAADLLKDKMVAANVFYDLKKMTPMRQIEVSTLMNDAGNYTGSYAKALLAATPRSQMANPEKPKKIRGLTEEQMTRMENEMATLQNEYVLIEENYGGDVMNLTLARGYLSSLLANAKVVRYLAQHHAEVLAQFQKISEMTTLHAKETKT
jgi:hypothetical protein